MISKRNIFALELRQGIYKFIKKNPGLHQNKISRKMNIPKSTLIHHLKHLEKLELINSDNNEGLKRYYISYELGRQEKEILKLLRGKVPKLIIVILLSYRACSQVELCERLGKSPKTINYHLKKLIDADIIEVVPIKDGAVQRLTAKKVVLRKPVGREIIYGFKSREIIRSIYKLLIANQNSIDNELLPVGFFDDLREDLNYKESPYYEMISYKDQVDAVIGALYEVFPHPYHV